MHKKDRLQLSDRQQFKYKKVEPGEIFPEYYLLKVNQFDNVAKDTLDEWIYYFKNNEIKDEFKAKGLDKVRTILKYDKLTEKEKKEYQHHIENLRYKASIISTLRAEEEYKVFQDGKTEGKIEGKIEIVRLMLSEKETIEKISKFTGLSKEEVEKIAGS